MKEGEKMIFCRKEFAKMVSCNPETLRRMHNKGTFTAERRASGSYYYTEEHFVLYSGGKLTVDDFCNKIYHLGEAAVFTGLNTKTLQRLDRQGILVAYINPEGKRFYTHKQLVDFMKGR